MHVDELWAEARGTSVRVRALDPGAGPAVVVVHGLVTSVDGLRSAVPGLDPYAALAAQGLRVLAVDWPGHGRSGGPRGLLTYHHAMETVAEAVGLARARWDVGVGVLGTGLGGTLAFYAGLEGVGGEAVVAHTAMDLRDVRSVLHRSRQQALLPLASRLRGWAGEGVQRAVALPARLVVSRADFAADPELRDRLWGHPQAVRRYPVAGLGSILLAPDEKPDVAAQRVPVLIAVGSEDRTVAPTAARVVATRCSGDAQIWTLPGAGHQLLLEHHRAAVPRMAAFLHEHLA